jgi:hypothetical protein
MRLTSLHTFLLLCLTTTVALAAHRPLRPQPAVLFAQRIPIVARADLPIGLGIARVMPQPGSILRFYGQPGVGQTPDDYPPADVVKFGPGQPSVEILEAPPWLVPEHLKMDYELFQLRALTLTPAWVEVIGNSRTGESWWVDRSQVQFASWPEFLLGVSSVEPFDAEANPVRARPLDNSPILSTASAPLPPLAVQGDWMKVAIGHLADRIQPEGWIRWRRGDRLLVTYSPLS